MGKMNYKIDLSKEEPKNIFIAVSDPYYSQHGDEVAICIIRKKDDNMEVLHTAVTRYEGRPDYYKELMEISKYYEGHTIVKETDEREEPRNYRLQHKIDSDKYKGLANRIGKEEGKEIVDGYLIKTNKDRLAFPSLLDEWLNMKAPDRFSISIKEGYKPNHLVLDNCYFRKGDKITSLIQGTENYTVVNCIMVDGQTIGIGWDYEFDKEIPQVINRKYYRLDKRGIIMDL